MAVAATHHETLHLAVSGSQRKQARRAPAGRDGVDEHEGDAQAHREADAHGDELEGGLEAGQIRLVRRRARLLLLHEREEAPVREPRGQLEQDPGDLREEVG